MCILQAYADARGPIAGEVWLLPTFLYPLGLLGGLCGVAALVSVHQSGGRLRGRWLSWISIGLTVLFPLSGLFWGELIRWVKSN